MASQNRIDDESNRQRDFLTEPCGSFFCEKKMSNEKQIEQEIQDKGLNAPRLTPDHIDSVIQSVHYFTAADDASNADNNYDPLVGAPSQLYLLTFCVIVLKNGFKVTGESACANPENFDRIIGQKIAYENAREKIWMLEGYLLKEKLSTSKQ